MQTQNAHLAIASVPVQSWGELYDQDAALKTGTIFKDLDANVKHFFTLLGKMFFTSYGKEFFTYPGKQIFTLYGKYFFT